jgi:hypothetical protein
LLELKATASEYGEVRNSLDLVPCGKLRVLFRVDLEHDAAAREISRGLCDMRRSHPAGAAPGRPEINEHRNLAFVNDLIELLGIYRYGLCRCRQRRLTCSASTYVSEVF